MGYDESDGNEIKINQTNVGLAAYNYHLLHSVSKFPTIYVISSKECNISINTKHTLLFPSLPQIVIDMEEFTKVLSEWVEEMPVKIVEFCQELAELCNELEDGEEHEIEDTNIKLKKNSTENDIWKAIVNYFSSAALKDELLDELWPEIEDIADDYLDNLEDTS